MSKALDIADAVLADLMRRRDVKVPLLELHDQEPEAFAELRRDLTNVVREILLPVRA